jgi:ubiquitin carboxyl-terminal hydrolase 16/45
MGKTPKEEDADGNNRKKAPRVEPVDDAALTTDAAASAPSPTGSTPPKGEEAEKSPRKTASRLDDADLATAPGVSTSSPTRKTPRKEEAEGSPPRKSPRRKDKLPVAAVPLPTVPESSELIVKGAGRASDEKRCKCNHVITESAMEELSAIEESSPSLKSKDAWTCYGCWCDDKARIVKTRPGKSDHLICMTCYLHLCCGVGSIAYPFGHSRAHALRKKHWFAVLYCDPERGYCFKCNAEVPVTAKFGEGGNEVNLHQTHDIVSRKLLAPSPSVGKLFPQHCSLWSHGIAFLIPGADLDFAPRFHVF